MFLNTSIQPDMTWNFSKSSNTRTHIVDILKTHVMLISKHVSGNFVQNCINGTYVPFPSLCSKEFVLIDNIDIQWVGSSTRCLQWLNLHTTLKYIMESIKPDMAWNFSKSSYTRKNILVIDKLKTVNFEPHLRELRAEIYW